jgi:phosphopantetheinyl transferase (holo-ACP synthase)
VVAPPAAPPHATPGMPAEPVLVDTAEAYRQRLLFHGPCFQVLCGPAVLTAEGAASQITVRAPRALFASTEAPQLLLDPALLDGVGQLLALWSLQLHTQAAFPVGLGRLELYGMTPPPGTRVPLRVDVRGRQFKMLSIDVEIGDGKGGVWLRITDWKAWQFAWDPKLIDFQRDPARYLLSDRQRLPVPEGPCCQRIGSARLAGFDLALLARHYLRPDEMAVFHTRAHGTRQTQWLLGRIAAKDAARAWHSEPGAAFLHPAAFGLANDAHGRPHVTQWPSAGRPPMLSIAHCERDAVAIAHATEVGIDIERTAQRGDSFLRAFSTEGERALLGQRSGAVRDTWETRLWCAKEAMGKRLGTGVVPTPQHFEAQAFCPDGSLRMWHAASNTGSEVRTIHDGDHIIAVDLGARTGVATREPS